MKISVIGAGAFGTALAISADRAGNEVLLWARDREVVDSVRRDRTNADYLPGIRLAEGIGVTDDLAEVAAYSDTLLMVVPSQFFRGVLEELVPHLKNPVKVISGTKGIENETLERMSGVSMEVLGERLEAFAALSGPTFAIETARADPTVAVIASANREFARDMQHHLSSPALRLYESHDVVGVELAGSLKNVIAIAAGVLEGLGFGLNTNAALITRGLREITRLGVGLGGRIETFAGLAGMGDLVLTCTGALSRNRSVGVLLGKGQQLEDILRDAKFVAEGIKTAKSAMQLSEKHQIEMPITAEMYGVIYEHRSPREALQRLMTRSLKAEVA